MTELAELGRVDEVQRLEQGRALAPRPAAIEPDVAERGLDWSLDAGPIIRQILGREQPAFALLVRDDRTGDVSDVEGIARGLQPGVTSASRRDGGLLVGHELHRGGEILLDEHLADARRAAMRQIERRVGRKFAVFGLVLRDDLGHQRVDGETLARKADGGLGNLTEAHRAPLRERRDPGVGCCRHDGAQNALRDLAAVMLLEEVALAAPSAIRRGRRS